LNIRDMNMNLKKRAMLMTAGILFLAISMNTAILTYISYENHKDSVLTNAISASKALIKEITAVVSFGIAIENAGINEKLRDLAAGGAIGYAMVLDTNGRILYHNDKEYLGKVYKDAQTLKALTSEELSIQKWGGFYDIAIPLLTSEGGKMGIFRIGVKSVAINKQLYRLLLWSVGVTVLCFLLFGTLIYTAIARFITGPVAEMEKAATRIADGDLTVKLRKTGSDEIATLAEAIDRIALNFNNMLLKIRNLVKNVSSVAEHITESPESVLKIVDLQRNAIRESAQYTAEMNTIISSILESAESLHDSAIHASAAIVEMSSSVSSIAGSAQIYNSTSQDAAASISEMIASIRNVAESIKVLSLSSDDSTANLGEVESTTKEIHQNAERSVALADKVSSEASEKGLASIHKAIEGMEDIKRSMDIISETTNRLEIRSKEIETILSVLGEITDQTALLSLNAAIQAAQAGEHGVGFSVIAEEIKKLADKASLSTREIVEIVTAVQKETTLSAQAASQGLKTVERGVLIVGEAKDALNSIFDSSKASTEMSQMIQRATAEQTRVIKGMTDTFRQISEKIKHISYATGEQMKGSSFILEITEKIKNGSEQLMLATEEQSRSNKQLSTVAENVSAQAEQINSGINIQKQKSDEIVNIMKQIQKATEELMTSSRDMEGSIGALSADARTLFTEIQRFKI